MADLTGQKFNSLTVVSKVDSWKKGVKWYCKCDCGNYCYAFGSQLVKGITQSCGCKKQRRYTKKTSRDIYVENDGYLNLRIAIINQAVDDWKKGNRQKKADLERWFLSDWGQFISGDMGEIIVEKLRKGG